MKKFDRRTLVQCIALAVLVSLLGTALYIMSQSRAGLSPAEKNHLFVALTFHNEELAQRLRLTKYFSGIASGEGNASETLVDIGRIYGLWRRACADQDFAEVKQALGGLGPIVAASYYGKPLPVPKPADELFDELQRAHADDHSPQSRRPTSTLSEAEKKPLTLAEKERLFFDFSTSNSRIAIGERKGPSQNGLCQGRPTQGGYPCVHGRMLSYLATRSMPGHSSGSSMRGS